MEASKLTDHQVSLLALLGTNLTYEEIGKLLGKSPRTIHGFRDELFRYFRIHHRTALIVAGLRKKYISLNKIPKVSSELYLAKPDVVQQRVNKLFKKPGK